MFSAYERLEALGSGDHAFAEAFRAPSGDLSITVARWAAGATDSQLPHTENEVYFVVRGRATLQVEGEQFPAEPGITLYVAAGQEHRFVDIDDDLEVVIFWAPARHSRG